MKPKRLMELDYIRACYGSRSREKAGRFPAGEPGN